MVSFAGWSTEKAIDYNEVFDIEYNDDGSITMVSKETFIHDEEDNENNFEYKLVLRGTDMGAFSCGNTIVFELVMMPLPKYWHESVIRDAARTFGWEDEPIEKLYEMFMSSDAYDAGCTVRLDGDSIDYTPDDTLDDGYYYDILECEDAVKMMNAAAAVCLAMNSMRGFSLDRPWNRIGSTGWDALDHILHGADLLAPAFARYSKALEEQLG